MSALPSSFAGTTLHDKTWEGNPLFNLAAGTYEGVKGAVQLGAVMHGVHGLKGAHAKAAEHARLATPEGRLTEANRILNEAREQHRARNPDSNYHEFLKSPEAQRAQAEIQERGLIGEQRELGTAGEPGAPKAEPAARPDAAPNAEPKPEAAAHPEAKAESAQRAAAEAKAKETAPSTKAAAPGAHPDKAVDPATQDLRDGLPKSLTDSVDVRVNEKLEGNSVHVIPDPRGPGHGVRVEVGPHATPTDVLLHAHTIQTMRRYQGLLGKLRQFKDWFNLTTVGTRGWEAKLELEKLPGIIHERMQRLSEGALTPEAHQKLVDEINHLSKQIDAHQEVLNTPELREQPGRGFVAAEDSSKKPAPDDTAKTEAPPRSDLPDIKKKLETLPPERRRGIEEHMSKLDEAMRASDPDAYRSARDAIAEALEIPHDKVTDAIYAPRELRPDWDPNSLTPEERSALQGERFRADKTRRKELGERVAELKTRLKNEPIVREIVEQVARDLSLPRSDLIFNEMVEWIVSKGRIVSERMEGLPASERFTVQERIEGLKRLHAEHGNSPEFKARSEKLAHELGLKREVLEQEILPGYSGRRPEAKRLVDLLRGTAKERGMDLDGFLTRAALAENIGAITTIRERLRVIEPDAIIAVERGGAFLADVLAHGDTDIHNSLITVPKAKDKSHRPTWKRPSVVRDHRTGTQDEICHCRFLHGWWRIR